VDVPVQQQIKEMELEIVEVHVIVQHMLLEVHVAQYVDINS
jgi:hypothetical protein